MMTHVFFSNKCKLSRKQKISLYHIIGSGTLDILMEVGRPATTVAGEKVGRIKGVGLCELLWFSLSLSLNLNGVNAQKIKSVDYMLVIC